jgi:hypothetical protein
MKITRIIILGNFIEKIERKHQITAREILVERFLINVAIISF